MIRILPTAVEPVSWKLAFHLEAKNWWARILAFGRYKHVTAYAYLPGLRAWLIYEVTFDGTHIVVLPDCDESLQILAIITEGCDVLRIDRQSHPVRLFPRLGFFCTTSIKHLLGLRGALLTPDALWRHCIRHGAVIVHGKPQNAADPEYRRAVTGAGSRA